MPNDEQQTQSSACAVCGAPNGEPVLSRVSGATTLCERCLARADAKREVIAN